MMHKTSGIRGAAFRPARSPRASISSGVSSLAVGRSLGLRVLPCLFAGCVLVAVPENLVRARDGRTGVPHVTVDLAGDTGPEEPALSPKAASLRSRVGQQSEDRVGDKTFISDLSPGNATLVALLLPESGESYTDASAIVETRDAALPVAAFSAARIQADFEWDGNAGEHHLESRSKAEKLGASPQPRVAISPLDSVEDQQASARSFAAVHGKALREGGAGSVGAGPRIAYAPLPLDAVPGEIEVTYGTAVHALDAASVPVSLALEAVTASDFAAPRPHDLPVPLQIAHLPEAGLPKSEGSDLAEVRVVSYDAARPPFGGEEADGLAPLAVPASNFEWAPVDPVQTGVSLGLDLASGSRDVPTKAALDQTIGPIKSGEGQAAHQDAVVFPDLRHSEEPLRASSVPGMTGANGFVAPHGHGLPTSPLTIRLSMGHPARLEDTELLEVRLMSHVPARSDSLGVEDAGAPALPRASSAFLESPPVDFVQASNPPGLDPVFGADNAPAHAAFEQDIVPEAGREGRAAMAMASALTPQEEAPWTPDGAMDIPEQIRLGTLVELLSERFEPDELERFRRSPAFGADVPASMLKRAGILVASNSASDALVINLAGMQASPTGGAGLARADDGGGTDGFLGLSQSLVATASAGFDSNPFLGAFDDTAAASIRFQLAPTLSRSTERNTFRITGRAEHIEYLGNYDSLQNFGADLAASHRASERLEIDAGLTFQSNILATNLANPFFADDLDPGAPLPPTGNDITVLGQGQRRTQYGADAGLTYTLSERDQLRWSLTGRADRFDGDRLVESNFLAQQLQYSRQLDEGFSIGALVDASLIDFVGAAGGSARTITPQLQVRAALSPRLEATGSVGLAITRLEFGDLEDTTSALAGNLSLCNRSERVSLCINGSRQVLPAAIGGALLQTTAGVSYSLRVSERDTLQISGNYATASQPVTDVIGPNDFESINGFARYERQLDERLRLFVSAGYLNTSGNRPVDATNIQALVGITFDLGRSR
jgi:hypothetical protein